MQIWCLFDMKPIANTDPWNKTLAGIKIQVLIPMLGCMACMSLLFTASLGAEPSPAVEYLMREPVSMLDWGLAKIEEDLFRKRGVLTRNDGNLFELEPAIRVTYAWEKNRIQIFLKLTMQADVKKTSRRMAAVREHMTFVIAYLRGGLTMHPYDAFSGTRASGARRARKTWVKTWWGLPIYTLRLATTSRTF